MTLTRLCDVAPSDVCVLDLQRETRLLLPEPAPAAHDWRRGASGAADRRPARLARFPRQPLPPGRPDVTRLGEERRSQDKNRKLIIRGIKVFVMTDIKEFLPDCYCSKWMFDAITDAIHCFT